MVKSLAEPDPGKYMKEEMPGSRFSLNVIQSDISRCRIVFSWPIHLARALYRWHKACNVDWFKVMAKCLKSYNLSFCLNIGIFQKYFLLGTLLSRSCGHVANDTNRNRNTFLVIPCWVGVSHVERYEVEKDIWNQCSRHTLTYILSFWGEKQSQILRNKI